MVLEKKFVEAVDLLFADEPNPTKALRSGGLMQKLMKAVVERALQAEMDEHLGYKKYARSTDNNGRNGFNGKQLITDNGTIDLSVPRDRNGTFEPILVEKRQTRLEGFDDKILALYAKGMSISDIRITMQELYHAEVSESLISRVTDDVTYEVRMWQNRPLETIYTVVFFDCLFVKVRQDKRIINKAVYVSIGIDKSGHKDILGLWMNESESSSFWLSVLTELKNRGVEDIIIACTDNLNGMSEALASAFPKAAHQLCIVHQIRNSLKYVSYKDRRAVASDLKPIYVAPTEEAALLSLKAFEEKWSQKYSQIAKSWRTNWTNLATFLDYPQPVRRIIYTTNIIESANNQLRKVTRNKRVFPNDDSVLKAFYLTIREFTRKWTMPIRDWGEVLSHFMISFKGRI